ncbi:MAG: hypothetical protein ACREC4_00815 [Methylocella sp.]
MEPAARIIKLLGGEAAVAKITGTAVTAPYRWQYPRERGGTDGQIPSKYVHRIIAAAAGAGIILSPNDFFAFDEPKPSSLPQLAGAAE